MNFATTLDGAWTEVVSYVIGSGNDVIDINVSGVAGSSDFFKAVVE